MIDECKHPCGAWASRGSSSSPDHENDFRLYDCLICGTSSKDIKMSNEIYKWWLKPSKNLGGIE